MRKTRYPSGLHTTCSLSAWPMVPNDSDVSWLLWVEQDGQGNGADRLLAGRVKLQDDPIATTHAVFQDALEQLETLLGGPSEDPLF